MVLPAPDTTIDSGDRVHLGYSYSGTDFTSTVPIDTTDTLYVLVTDERDNVGYADVTETAYVRLDESQDSLLSSDVTDDVRVLLSDVSELGIVTGKQIGRASCRERV